MSRLFRKSGGSAPPGFFAAEAAGLRWLSAIPGAPPMPEVIEVGDDGIAMTHIDQGAATPGAAEDFGRALATMHRCAAPAYGANWPGFIGPLPLDNTLSTQPWNRWYADTRVMPFARRARDTGALSTEDVAVIERACSHLPATNEPPAHIHGDLWSGNVLWGREGRVWLIDPAAHGGHRETDLAMLALFGAPYLDRIIAAYDEAWPLADGWRERVGVHQLHPLLVHAALFGGGYGSRAVHICRLALT